MHPGYRTEPRRRLRVPVEPGAVGERGRDGHEVRVDPDAVLQQCLRTSASFQRRTSTGSPRALEAGRGRSGREHLRPNEAVHHA
ncbi:unnamed protein product, partial [Ectocarpus sp. 8 AP-2014]